MLRITGGTLRGRVIRPPKRVLIRPTTARVRSSLCQIWQHAGLLDAPFLDLFAGSGIMSLEALSRGVPLAVSIERSSLAVRAMQAQAKALGLASRWQIHKARFPEALAHLSQHRFGVVFADPPYRHTETQTIAQALDEAGIVCEELAIETDARLQPSFPAHWHRFDLRRYGSSAIHRLRRR